MNRPIVSPLGNGDWELIDAYYWRRIRVPSGFVCDFDSVPRIPGIYARYKGRATKSAIIHDWLYATKPVIRRDADRLFLEAMRDEAVAPNFRLIIYAAVRLFGWFPWWRSSI